MSKRAEDEWTTYDIETGRIVSKKRNDLLSKRLLKEAEKTPKLTEFEKAFGFASGFSLGDMEKPATIEHIKESAKELLELARKELMRECENKGIDPAKDEHYFYWQGFEAGKAEALKDLPRWKDNWDSLRPYKDISGLQYIVLNGKAINVSNLEKLPGFKED